MPQADLAQLLALKRHQNNDFYINDGEDEAERHAPSVSPSPPEIQRSPGSSKPINSTPAYTPPPEIQRSPGSSKPINGTPTYTPPPVSQSKPKFVSHSVDMDQGEQFSRPNRPNRPNRFSKSPSSNGVAQSAMNYAGNRSSSQVVGLQGRFGLGDEEKQRGNGGWNDVIRGQTGREVREDGRMERERMEYERKERERMERERMERERMERERMERERMERERMERERMERERMERERIERERIERERLERERLERERMERERIERERMERERMERERIERERRERMEKERIERERIERERKEREKKERERLEYEQRERERIRSISNARSQPVQTSSSPAYQNQNYSPAQPNPTPQTQKYQTPEPRHPPSSRNQNTQPTQPAQANPTPSQGPRAGASRVASTQRRGVVRPYSPLHRRCFFPLRSTTRAVSLPPKESISSCSSISRLLIGISARTPTARLFFVSSFM